MKKIEIHEIIKVAGIDYKVRAGDRINLELQASSRRGSHSALLREIDIRNDLGGQDTSCTFIHEVFHAINSVYCNGELREDDVDALSSGFHQVLEQLGVRFVLKG